MKRAGATAALILMLTTIGCDHVTKRIAAQQLAGTSGRSYFNDTIRLEYAENPGAFLSLGSTLPDWARNGLLIVGAGIGLITVASAALKFRWRGLPFFGASLFVAGGISNLLDRLATGSVVDFVNVGLGSVRTGVFNVADVALLAGVGLMAFGARKVS
jgi:signal peptidase II